MVGTFSVPGRESDVRNIYSTVQVNREVINTHCSHIIANKYWTKLCELSQLIGYPRTGKYCYDYKTYAICCFHFDVAGTIPVCNVIITDMGMINFVTFDGEKIPNHTVSIEIFGWVFFLMTKVEFLQGVVV